MTLGKKNRQLPGAAGGSGSSGVLATRNSGPLGSKLTPLLPLASARMMMVRFTIFRCLKALGFHLSTVYIYICVFFSHMNSNFKPIPNNPCMVYFPTFTQKINQINIPYMDGMGMFYLSQVVGLGIS